MRNQHSPGPWKLVKSTTAGQFVTEYRVRLQDGGMVCEIGPILQEENGLLIAAAPEMLTLLKSLGDKLCILGLDVPEIDKLIKKVEGSENETK